MTGDFDNDSGFAAQLDAAIHDVHRRVRLTADVVDRHVTAVLALQEDGNPEFVGSGLYARLADRFYVVTAAHVLDLCDGGVYLPHLAHLGDPLSGTMIVTAKPPGQSRAKDPFDIGFVRLSSAEVSEIGEHNFADLLNTIDRPPSEPVLIMIVLGYPTRDQTMDNSARSMQTQITMMATGAVNERMSRVTPHDPRTHLLLRYQRRTIMYNGKTVGSPPSIHGMSGGGIWPVPLHVDPSRLAPPALAGMLIERPARFKSSVLAIRAPVIRAFVRKHDDSL